MSYIFYRGDLPAGIDLGKEVAIDTETLGLNHGRDRLCLIQLCGRNTPAHVVQFERGKYNAPNLVKILRDKKILKIMHFARFDMAILQKTFGFKIKNVFCTKIASKIARTYADVHGLKVLVKEIFNVDISKREQSSYWGGEISEEQLKYAGNDVLYLHRIKDYLENILEREGRKKYFVECLKFLNTRVNLDLNGWIEDDIFSH
ncbi:MAG: ribonuclease D [Rickettsiales bacterium]|jgi:ribonuclease D|nr:ribonuclease D [Rickettsiales bacterium]